VIRIGLGTSIAALALSLVLSGSVAGPRTHSAAERTNIRAASAAPAKPHAVLLIMDEFPSDSLLGPGGRIDAVRYPNFAALAEDSTWFRDAYSVYDSTTKAVPLILDGVRPHPGTSPDRADHPHSLFDMFHRRGYRVDASEEASALCPPSICRGARSSRPAIIPNLMSGRPQRFKRWVRRIRAGRRPTFWMKHLLMPHGPYIYLPSGAQTRPAPRDLLPGMNTVPGFHDEFLTRHNEQRYLLQLGYADRLLGRLIRRLKDQGIYDDTLIVVTADHGYAWQAGVATRRSVSPSNVAELTPVPLFVKRPGQRRGRVSGALARTLDIASTMADVLGYRLGYRDDGRSAFSRAARRRRKVSLTTRDFSRVVTMPARRWRALRRKVVQRRLRQFGAGDLSTLFTGIGPHRGLLGRSAGELARAAGAGVRAAIVQEDLFANVRRGSGVLPAQIAGDLSGGSPGEKRDVAVALNGRIEAVGRSFYLRGDPTEHFALMVPESALREGRNSVELFEVVAGERLRLLARN
jgi:Sulfatase